MISFLLLFFKGYFYVLHMFETKGRLTSQFVIIQNYTPFDTANLYTYKFDITMLEHLQ